MTRNIRGWVALGLLFTGSTSALEVELKRATFVPGVISANLFNGLAAIAAEPETRFPGCVQQPTRLMFGTTAQTGVRNWSTEKGQRDFLTLLVEAKRAGSPVTMSYVVGSNGFCYFRGLSF
ncbi:MAG: hypothetical protein K2Y51_10185 [Gammaproteobacteria bacterium]|jgi:hypothetical protein|nr:hypothetical protein [Gammaproteobacteria bacterium]